MTSVVKYFDDKAERYDEVDTQPYWVFSDDLLWEILKERVLNKYSADNQLHLIDAGCGTCRWSFRILEMFPHMSGLLLDQSQNMLNVSQEKVSKFNIKNNVSFLKHDLNEKLPENIAPADILISFHSVLSFLNDPYTAIEDFKRHVKKGGYILLGVPNFFHALYFSLNNKKFVEMDRVFNEHKVKFTDTVPEMWVFKPEAIKEKINGLGLTCEDVYGFPVSIYPTQAETTLDGSAPLYDMIFKDKNQREKLLSSELKLILDESVSSRGNNLLVICRVHV